MPAVRLAWFADQFEFSTFQSICAEDFGDQITFIGSTVRAAIQNGSDARPAPSSSGGCSASPRDGASSVLALALVSALALLAVALRRVIARTR
jgi:uncharacterized protein (TIGR03382 family)